MDAVRLIKNARRALAEARSHDQALTEAWQAARLTEAVGGRLSDDQDGELAALGELLAAAGGHARSRLGAAVERRPRRGAARPRGPTDRPR